MAVKMGRAANRNGLEMAAAMLAARSGDLTTLMDGAGVSPEIIGKIRTDIHFAKARASQAEKLGFS